VKIILKEDNSVYLPQIRSTISLTTYVSFLLMLCNDYFIKKLSRVSLSYQLVIVSSFYILKLSPKVYNGLKQG